MSTLEWILVTYCSLQLCINVIAIVLQERVNKLRKIFEKEIRRREKILEELERSLDIKIESTYKN